MQASLLRQLPCCSLPRALTYASASTSAPHPPLCSPAGHAINHSGSQLLQQSQQQSRRRGVVARITGKREEYVLDGITDPEDIWGEEADQEFIEIDNTPIWSPERGPVGERIFRDPDEERETKEISIEDTAYWFAENNGGELPRTQWKRKLKEVDVETADEQLRCENVEGYPERLKLEDLEEGDELVGVVTDIWLWHGAFVDVLADFKGLIPIRQQEWRNPEVHNNLLPGTEVIVRVHKLSEFPKYRFPIQLELLTPEEVPALIMSPDDYKVPANVAWCYEQGWDINRVAAELGREYEDQVTILEPDHAAWADDLQFEFGHDAPDGDRYPNDWLTRELDEPGMRETLQEAAVDPKQWTMGPGLL